MSLTKTIVALLAEQVAVHQKETNVLVEAGDAKSAADHAYREAKLYLALQIMIDYAKERQE